MGSAGLNLRRSGDRSWRRDACEESPFTSPARSSSVAFARALRAALCDDDVATAGLCGCCSMLLAFDCLECRNMLLKLNWRLAEAGVDIPGPGDGSGDSGSGLELKDGFDFSVSP